MKIYTKTGDKGETALFGGRRVSKSHLRIDAYGTVDELNAFVGLLRDSIEEEELRRELFQIQERLFTIGSNLASDPEKELSVPDIRETDIDLLEAAMDRMDEGLPPLRHFILPGGHQTVSYCHLARCVCRRTERLVVALQGQSPVEGILIQYLNRLSDYFFILGRFVGHQLGVKEVKWIGRKG